MELQKYLQVQTQREMRRLMRSMSNLILSRRKFITAGVGFAAGACLMGCGANTQASPATTSVASANDTANANANPTAGDGYQALPWAYEPIDPEVVRKRGYENYFEGACCYAAGKALIDTIKEQVGGPWGTLPPEMLKYGRGGAVGWGTLCGALNGSLLVMNLVAGDDVTKLGDELIGWYTMFPFPTTAMDSYAKFPNQVTTVAGSPLCHISVSLWANAANAKINSDEKADRCAKVTGDTAAQAAMILNDWKAGKFTPTYAPGSEFASCLTCHNGSKSVLDNEQGKMNCTACHTDKLTGHP